MKTHRAFFLLLALSILVIYKGHSQSITLCGMDTVVLHVSNYQHGPIQWEESSDSVNWVAITGANDTVYRFFPTEPKYYRTVVRFSDCPPEYSAISFVGFPPVADAGPDRRVPGAMLELKANRPQGTSGTWTAINGMGGIFSDALDPNSAFTGSNATYTLVWTLSNPCGTSNDTMVIDFIQNQFVSSIVVVDTTDQMLSDSTMLAQGIYKIKFSVPVPSITSSTILIGLSDEGFLRRVTSFYANTDTFTLTTEQATLEDITVNGAYDLMNLNKIDTTINKSGGVRQLDRLPTRAELVSDPSFQNQICYFQRPQKFTSLLKGVTVAPLSKGSDEMKIVYASAHYHKSYPNGSSVDINLSGSSNLKPNLVCDYEFSTSEGLLFKLGMYNAVMTHSVKLDLDVVQTSSLLESDFEVEFLSATSYQLIIIGGVPIITLTNVKFVGEFNFSTSINMSTSLEFNSTNTFSKAVEYKNGSVKFVNNETHSTTFDSDFDITGNLEQVMKIGPEVSFKVFGVVGPYVKAKLAEKLNFCYAPFILAWDANATISGEIKLGAEAKIIKKELFDLGWTFEKEFFHSKMPSTVSIHSGNFQQYTLGSPLPNPIKVKVQGSKGLGIPLVVVRFEDLSNGSVQNATVVTNIHGEAQTYWTPGGVSSSNLKATVLDCDGNHLTSSPLFFSATETLGTLNCAMSSLTATYSIQGDTLTVTGNLGVPPYTYSQNGTTFSSNTLKIPITPGQSYTFYVKDQPGCVATKSYQAPAFTCFNSGLAVNLWAAGNAINLLGTGGVPPYTYAIDNISGPYQGAPCFTNLLPGYHTAYIKDALGCIAQSSIIISSQINTSLTVDFSSSTTSTFTGQPVNFTNLSSGAASTWFWNFGDGTSSTQQNPVHSFSLPGVYTVSLTAGNSQGSNTHVKNNYIQVVLNPNGQPCPGMPTVTDYNGNIYNTVQIGTQCWMKENLKSRNYKNGTTIPNITNNSAWLGLSTDARCWYNNDSATFAATYGALYNWYAVDNSNGLCPTGWHVPTDLEWQTLEMYLGMSQAAANSTGNRGTDEGGKMKEAGLVHWNSPNTGATNSSGFTALPGGYRYGGFDGNFYNTGIYGFYWSSTANSSTSAWPRWLGYDISGVVRLYYNNIYGFSVRCVRDY